MKNILVITALTFSTALNAQLFDWAISTTNTTHIIDALSSAHLSNNQSVVVGHILGASSGDFDPGSGTQVLSDQGGNTTYIASYDYHGNYLWAFTINAGAGDVYVDDVAADASDNIYVTGALHNATNADFDPGPGTAFLSTFGPNAEVFYLASYDHLGNYRWAFVLGGGNQAGRGSSLTTTPAGNVVVAGSYCAGGNPFDFDPGAGNSNTPGHYGMIAFMAWYTAAGNFIRVVPLSGNGETTIHDISSDNIGSVYISGNITTQNMPIDFDPSAASYTVTSQYYWCAFVARYSPNGFFGWVNVIQGSGYIVGKRVSSDNAGHAYVALSYYGQIDDVDPGAGVVPYYNPSGDIATCLIQLAAGSGAHNWSFEVRNTTVGSLETDNYGEVYLCGRVTITQTIPDFDPGPGVVNPTSGLGVYISRYTVIGTFYSWIEITNNGNGDPIATHLDATNTGELYVSGWYNITLDFDPSASTYTLPVSGDENMFLVRYVTHPTGLSDPQTDAVAVYPNPVNNLLNIQGEHTGAKLNVHSSLGECVICATLQGNAPIDVSQLPAGIYFAELVDENDVRSVFQFVKQ